MSDRIYKINELLKEEIGQIIQKDVSPDEGVLTVTAVETTNDLRHSLVWLSFFGQNEGKAAEAIEAKTKDIQAKINHRLSLKHVPKLEFRFDRSGAYADHINQIFKNIDNK